MYALADQLRTPRIVQGTKIPHPCGDPILSPEEDLRLRREIVSTALRSLQASVTEPTLFKPNATFVFG